MNAQTVQGAGRRRRKNWQCLLLAATFFMASSSHGYPVLVCGSWNASTSVYTPYTVATGQPASTAATTWSSAAANCPFAYRIWVDDDVLEDWWPELTTAQGVTIGGSIMMFVGFCWLMGFIWRTAAQQR